MNFLFLVIFVVSDVMWDKQLKDLIRLIQNIVGLRKFKIINKLVVMSKLGQKICQRLLSTVRMFSVLKLHILFASKVINYCLEKSVLVENRLNVCKISKIP